MKTRYLLRNQTTFRFMSELPNKLMPNKLLLMTRVTMSQRLIPMKKSRNQRLINAMIRMTKKKKKIANTLMMNKFQAI